MTISSSNLLPIMPVNLGSLNGEGLTAQLSSELVDLEVAKQPIEESNFWTMLNQELAEFIGKEEVQATENKEVYSFFGEGESVDLVIDDSIDFIEMEDKTSTEWMQVMKSHFLDAELPEESEILLNKNIILPEEEIIEEDFQPVSIMSIAEKQSEKEALLGDELPRQRQDISVTLPAEEKTSLPVMEKSLSDARQKLEIPVFVNPAMTKQVHIDSAKVDIDPGKAGVDTDGVEFDLEAEQKAIFQQPVNPGSKMEGMDQDKFQFKQALSESGQFMKENTPTVQVSQVSQVSAQVPQNQVIQQLPSTLQLMQLPAQPTSTEWGDALGERVSFLMNNKLNIAEIRIDPPHLGKLDIQIQIKDDSTSVVIHTQNAQTRELIESASARLKEFLQDAGYKSVDVSVSHQEKSMDQQGFSENSNKEMLEDESIEDSNVQNLSALNMTGAQITVDNGRIDYFA